MYTPHPHPSPSSSGTTQPSSPITAPISRQLTAAAAWCCLAGGLLLLPQPWRKASEPENCCLPPVKEAGDAIGIVKFVPVYMSVLLACGLCFPWAQPGEGRWNLGSQSSLRLPKDPGKLCLQCWERLDVLRERQANCSRLCSPAVGLWGSCAGHVSDSAAQFRAPVIPSY